MRVGHGVEVSYNVQIVVDHKHKLVVEHEVTNIGNDRNWPLAEWPVLDPPGDKPPFS